MSALHAGHLCLTEHMIQFQLSTNITKNVWSMMLIPIEFSDLTSGIVGECTLSIRLIIIKRNFSWMPTTRFLTVPVFTVNKCDVGKGILLQWGPGLKRLNMFRADMVLYREGDWSPVHGHPLNRQTERQTDIVIFPLLHLRAVTSSFPKFVDNLNVHSVVKGKDYVSVNTYGSRVWHRCTCRD